MLTEDGLSIVLDRLGSQSADLRELQQKLDAARDANVAFRGDLQDAKAECDGLRKQCAALAADFQHLQEQRDAARTALTDATSKIACAKDEVFPFRLRRDQHIYVAFADGISDVGRVKDDAGDYTFAGEHKDMQTFVAAPLNPRCYATFPPLNLFRLPGAPTGKLVIDDNLPF
jgi:hypothetical protein